MVSIGRVIPLYLVSGNYTLLVLRGIPLNLDAWRPIGSKVTICELMRLNVGDICGGYISRHLRLYSRAEILMETISQHIQAN